MECIQDCQNCLNYRELTEMKEDGDYIKCYCINIPEEKEEYYNRLNELEEDKTMNIYSPEGKCFTYYLQGNRRQGKAWKSNKFYAKFVR